jgi:predicted ATPase/tetratricopeptide (TPR) repeat protein
VVSIVGTGGLGKTRLAHVVARSAEQPVVHFVELAGVTSAEGVPIAVADALGVRESVSGRPAALGHADLLTRLLDAVGALPTLLVLDNCEHLVAAAADLVEALLTRTPRLTVLTTTRVPLGLPAERTYLLPELSPGDAAALFAERATAARPGVVLDEAEVAELVARLDGLPLALELAAAKVRSMSVAEITRRLENRFALLRGGSRVAPERHQTLLAVIDWSWNLLTEQQRVALRRLAVFRDGFSLETASELLGHDAREVVTALVEHSLIVVRESIDVRYRLLETVREFGRMQLVDAGDDTFVERRLREWAIGLATDSLDRLFTTDQVATVALMRGEEGNLVDVVRRGLAEGDTATVATLFAALAGFWMIEGTHLKVMNLGPAVTNLVLSVANRPELDDVVRLALSFAVTNDVVFRDAADGPGFNRLRELGPGSNPTIAAAIRVLIDGFAVAKESGDLASLAALGDDPDPAVARLALLWTSHAHENLGDLAAARIAARRALDLTDDSTGPWMRGILSAMVGGLALHRGDWAEARIYIDQALPVLRTLGAVEDYAQTRANLAMVAVHEGRFNEAEAILDELAAEDGAQTVFGGALGLLCGRAELLLARGETDAGLAAYTQALAVLRNQAIDLPNLPDGMEPWLVLPQAALVAAYARRGLRAQDQRDDLLARVRNLTARGGFTDVPVLGCTLLALGIWELTFGARDAGARLLGYADRYAFSRMLPSLDWAWATSLAQPADIPPGTPAQLYESLHALLYTLRP